MMKGNTQVVVAFFAACLAAVLSWPVWRAFAAVANRRWLEDARDRASRRAVNRGPEEGGLPSGRRGPQRGPSPNRPGGASAPGATILRDPPKRSKRRGGRRYREGAAGLGVELAEIQTSPRRNAGQGLGSPLRNEVRAEDIPDLDLSGGSPTKRPKVEAAQDKPDAGLGSPRSSPRGSDQGWGSPKQGSKQDSPRGANQGWGSPKKGSKEGSADNKKGSPRGSDQGWGSPKSDSKPKAARAETTTDWGTSFNDDPGWGSPNPGSKQGSPEKLPPKSPEKSPPKSPPKASPPKSPVRSPQKSPTKTSPQKSPEKSPERSPEKSPPKSPTKTSPQKWPQASPPKSPQKSSTKSSPKKSPQKSPNHSPSKSAERTSRPAAQEPSRDTGRRSFLGITWQANRNSGSPSKSSPKRSPDRKANSGQGSPTRLGVNMDEKALTRTKKWILEGSDGPPMMSGALASPQLLTYKPKARQTVKTDGANIESDAGDGPGGSINDWDEFMPTFDQEDDKEAAPEDNNEGDEVDWGGWGPDPGEGETAEEEKPQNDPPQTEWPDTEW